MLLFDDFKAVKFIEEDLILITESSELKYIYFPKYKVWKKFKNSYDYIDERGWTTLLKYLKTNNYQDIDGEEIIKAMNGVFPRKESDFIKLCVYTSLDVDDYLKILKQDYPQYMIDKIIDSNKATLNEKLEYHSKIDGKSIYDNVYILLYNSTRVDKTYNYIRNTFDEAVTKLLNKNEVNAIIQELSKSILEKDITNEILIRDGHCQESGFWIMPAKISYLNTVNYIGKKQMDKRQIDYISSVNSPEISIDYNNYIKYCGVDYIIPFLINNYDNNIDANVFVDNLEVNYKEGDDATINYNSINYYTLESMNNVINDIKNTIDALSKNKQTKYTIKLDKIDSQIDKNILIDFYQKFIYRIEYMIKVSNEKGYDLILWEMA